MFKTIKKGTLMYKKVTLIFSIIIMTLFMFVLSAEASTYKTINIGGTTKLTVKTKKSVQWSSSNTEIISVDRKGNITAKQIGKATIKAKTKKKTYKFIIRVIDTYSDSTKILDAKNHNIKIIAHRGMSSLAPENTLEAMELAASYDFEMVEFDISETKDGRFVVMHDSSVDRTTNGAGEIGELTYEQIKSYTIDGGNGYDKWYKSIKVPSLEEALKVCKKRNLTPLIHIKHVNDTSKLLKVIKKSGFSKKAILCTSNTNTLLQIKKSNKIIKLMIVVSRNPKNAIRFAEKNKLMGINISSKLLDIEKVNEIKRNKMTLFVWDVYSKKRFDKLIKYGIDGVLSDGILK